MTQSSKLIVFSCGGKGGVGKTTVATAIADFYAARDIPATLFDCDTENKQRGSLSHFFPTATKLDIRAERGLDRFVDTMLAAETPVALADLAAGSGRAAFEWIDTMFDGLAAEGFRFTAVATITSAASSVEISDRGGDSRLADAAFATAREDNEFRGLSHGVCVVFSSGFAGS